MLVTGIGAWTLAWYLYPVSADLSMVDLVPMIIGSLGGAVIANLGYPADASRAKRSINLPLNRAAGWLIGWLLVSIWLWFLLAMLQFACTGFDSPSSACISDADTLTMAAGIGGAFGGVVGGLIFGLGDRRSTRYSFQYSRMLVPAAIVGWAAAWAMLASFSLDLVLVGHLTGSSPTVSPLSARGDVFIGAIAGGVAGIPSVLMYGVLHARLKNSNEAGDANPATETKKG